MLGLARLNLNILRRPVQHETLHGANLPRLNYRAGSKARQGNFSRVVRVINAVIRADIRAASVDDFERHAGERFIRRAGDEFPNHQRTHGRVVENDRVRAVGFHPDRLRFFRQNVTGGSVGFRHHQRCFRRQAGHGGGSVCPRQAVGNDFAATVLHGKLRAGERGQGHAVPLHNRQGGERLVVERNRLHIVRRDDHRLRLRVQIVVLRGLGFRHDIGGGVQTGEGDLPVGIRPVNPIA